MIIMNLKLLGLFFLLLVCAASDDPPANLEKQAPQSDLKKDFSLFSSMMNIFNPNPSQDKKPQAQQKSNQKPENQLNLARSIFQSLSKVKKYRQNKNSEEEGEPNNVNLRNSLPLQLLLPRRRNFPKLGDDELPQNFGAGRKRDRSDKHFDILNKFLQEAENGQSQGKIHWSNPTFTDDERGEEMGNFKIFGGKQKGRKKHGRIDRELVETLLQEKIPFFEGGHIVNLHQVVYKKGVSLNIDYLIPGKNDQQEKTYAITAKFKPKNHDLQIITLKEKFSPFSGVKREVEDIVVEDDFEEAESDDLLQDEENKESFVPSNALELSGKDERNPQKQTAQEQFEQKHEKPEAIEVEDQNKEVGKQTLAEGQKQVKAKASKNVEKEEEAKEDEKEAEPEEKKIEQVPQPSKQDKQQLTKTKTAEEVEPENGQKDVTPPSQHANDKSGKAEKEEESKKESGGDGSERVEKQQTKADQAVGSTDQKTAEEKVTPQ